MARRKLRHDTQRVGFGFRRAPAALAISRRSRGVLSGQSGEDIARIDRRQSESREGQ